MNKIIDPYTFIEKYLVKTIGDVTSHRPLEDRNILNIGCGNELYQLYSSLRLARAGAHVVGIDNLLAKRNLKFRQIDIDELQKLSEEQLLERGYAEKIVDPLTNNPIVSLREGPYYSRNFDGGKDFVELFKCDAQDYTHKIHNIVGVSLYDAVISLLLWEVFSGYNKNQNSKEKAMRIMRNAYEVSKKGSLHLHHNLHEILNTSDIRSLGYDIINYPKSLDEITILIKPKN